MFQYVSISLQNRLLRNHGAYNQKQKVVRKEVPIKAQNNLRKKIRPRAIIIVLS